MTSDRWEEKAIENVDRWGIQDVETLLLAIQEETGELAQAYLEARAEGGDPSKIEDELEDLGALCIQLQERLEDGELIPFRSGTVVSEFDVSEDHMAIKEPGRYQLVKLEEGSA